MARPHGKYATVNPRNPEAFAQCSRCGFWYNRSKLAWQMEWGGQQLFNTGVLLCYNRCYDTPNEQLRTIILPPDPPPIINSREPNFTYEESGPIQTTLSANVAQGATVLPVVAITGFVVGNLVWVQLDNSTFGQMQISAIDPVLITITLTDPLPYSAPYTGSVTVSIVGR